MHHAAAIEIMRQALPQRKNKEMRLRKIKTIMKKKKGIRSRSEPAIGGARLGIGSRASPAMATHSFPHRGVTF